mmetsp:Transcript_3546/g.5714  ORF Transcript_3546/g.5714 Transcript_3546/m.5714 type:complete len:332 (+) Transcript_3546:40-1035(+)
MMHSFEKQNVDELESSTPTKITESLTLAMEEHCQHRQSKVVTARSPTRPSHRHSLYLQRSPASPKCSPQQQVETPRSIATPLRSKCRGRDADASSFGTPMTPRALKLDLAHMFACEASPPGSSAPVVIGETLSARSSFPRGIQQSQPACKAVTSTSRSIDFVSIAAPGPSSPGRSPQHCADCVASDDVLHRVVEVPVRTLLVSPRELYLYSLSACDPRQRRFDSSSQTVIIPTSASTCVADGSDILPGSATDPRNKTQSKRVVARSRPIQALTPCKRLLPVASREAEQTSESGSLKSSRYRSPTPCIEERRAKLRSARARTPTPTPSRIER